MESSTMAGQTWRTTTKGIGMGTGLGLSVVYGIVKNHQGAVKVESHPGARIRLSGLGHQVTVDFFQGFPLDFTTYYSHNDDQMSCRVKLLILLIND